MIETDILKLQKENEFLREENRILRQKVDLLIRQIFGKKSEKLSSGQLEMLLGDDPAGQPPASVECAAPAEAPKKASAPKERQARYPENLPVEEQIMDPSEVEAAPELWRQIGEEVSEQLDYQPGRFFRRRLIRRTWVKRNDPDGAPVTAELPPKLLERGILAPGLLAQIVVSKYADHLPLYRQEQIFRQRHGVALGRNTLCRGVELVAEWLKPVARQMLLDQLKGGYVQLDETPVQYLCSQKGSAKGFFWASNVPGGDSVFHWAPGRGYEHLKRWLPDKLDCIIQSDDYSPYQILSKETGVIAHARCWAHVRRKFVDALSQGENPVRLNWILHQIGLLYAVERRLREQKAGPALRAAVRQSESRLIMDRLTNVWQAMFRVSGFKPQSLTGKAVAYALRQREGLRVCLEHGRVEIDNNRVENAIRPVALGRKNFLFIGDRDAGWRSAVLYSVAPFFMMLFHVLSFPLLQLV